MWDPPLSHVRDSRHEPRHRRHQCVCPANASPHSRDGIPHRIQLVTHRRRDSMYTPQTVAEADFFVNCPKFTAHPWTTVTFSLKSLDDSELR